MNSTTLNASDLRTLAQYLLAAAKQLQQGTLSDDAASLLGEWNKAAPHLRSLVREWPHSHADKIAHRAVAMLCHDQTARDEAYAEVAALLEQSDALKNQLADADWVYAGEVIGRTAILTYLSGLEKERA